MTSLSKLVKSYLTSITQDQLLRIHPVQIQTPCPIESQIESPLEEAKEQAAFILADAEKQYAEKILSLHLLELEQRQTIEAEAERLYETKSQEGFALGYQNGRDHALQEYQHYLSTAKELLLEARKQREEFLGASEELLQTLALAIAEKIIRREVSHSIEVVSGIIKSCLFEVHQKGIVEIHVSPEEYPMIQERKPELTSCLPGQTEILLIPDSSVTSGGCFILTEHGNMDAKIETGLEEIRKALREVCGGVSW